MSEISGRTYRYNEKTGVWKNLTIQMREGNIFLSVMEGGGKGDRKSISFKLTPAEAAYFAMILKMAVKKSVEEGMDINGKKIENDF